MKIYDQHVHSYYSFDSKVKIEDYLDKAVDLGLDYFILTDHCDLNFLDKNEDIFFDVKKQFIELKKLQLKYPKIKILHGIEVGYKPSELNRINDIIKDNHFDLINLSLHESDRIDYYHFEEFKSRGVDKTLELYFSRQLEMVQDYDDYDVLCHIDYGFKSAYLGDNSLDISKYEKIISRIFKEIIKKEKALEINVKVQEALPVEHTKYLLNLYKKLGGTYLTISTDSHFSEKYYKNIDKYIAIAKESGFTHLTYFIDRKKHLLAI